MKNSGLIGSLALVAMLGGCGEPDLQMGDCDMAAMTEEMTEKMRELGESGDTERREAFAKKAAEIQKKTVAGLEDQSYTPEEACEDYKELFEIAG